MTQTANKSRFCTALPVLLIAGLSIAVYFNALWNGFVYDDVDQVLQNAWIRDVRLVPEIFANNAWGFAGARSANYYRPMMHIAYMAAYYLFGLAPWGFHLVNILFHAGVSVLVYLLSVRLLPKAGDNASSTAHPAALTAAALFAVNPIHTEAVTWVAGVPEVSYAFFYLASFLVYVRARDEGGRGLTAASVALFLVSCMCKETALTLPVLIACYEHFFRDGEEGFFSRARRYAPFLIAALAYLAVRQAAIGGFAPRSRHPELSGYDYVINIFPLFAGYLHKMLFPLNLNAFHQLHPIHSLAKAKGAISLVVTVLFVAAAALSRRRHKALFLCLAIMSVPLLPVFYIRGLGENTFAERYLYLPSMGFSMLAGLSIGGLVEKRQYVKTAVLAFVLLVCAYSAGTISRNTVWKDGFTLWTDTVAKSPDASLPHQNLGLEYLAMLDLDTAMKEFRIARRLEPFGAAVHNNMGVVYYAKGMLDKAIDEYSMAVQISPDVSNAHNNLGQVYADKGLDDKAMDEYMAAVRLNPANEKAYFNAGELYYRQGRLDEAIKEYRTAIEMKPSVPKYHNSLGAAYFDKGMLDEAIAEHEAAIRLDPSDGVAYYRLGLVLKAMGDLDGAIANYRMAIRFRPSPAVYNNLGNAYASQGNFDSAIEQYEKALGLDPGYALATGNIELARKLKAAGPPKSGAGVAAGQ